MLIERIRDKMKEIGFPEFSGGFQSYFGSAHTSLETQEFKDVAEAVDGTVASWINDGMHKAFLLLQLSNV